MHRPPPRFARRTAIEGNVHRSEGSPRATVADRKDFPTYGLFSHLLRRRFVYRCVFPSVRPLVPAPESTSGCFTFIGRTLGVGTFIFGSYQRVKGRRVNRIRGERRLR
jgi:hypothetical protein